MAKISSIGLNVVPVEFILPYKHIASVSINHDSTSSIYTFLVKYDGESVFSPLLDDASQPVITSSKFVTVFLDPTKQYADLRVDYDEGGNTVSFCPDRIDFSTGECFVQVNGRILDLQGRPAECAEIHVILRPDMLDFCIGDKLVDNVDNHVYSDSDGYWSIMLAPNKASDEFKKIKDNKTFYSFSIFGKSMEREIDLDNGLVQNFNSLLMPEHHRIKKDVYFDLRN